MTGLERLLDWLGATLVQRVALSPRDGAEPGVGWLLPGVDGSVICLDVATGARDAARDARRECAGDLLVPLVG